MKRAWSKQELLVVFRLYCCTQFGRLHQRNPEIIEIAGMIERSPGAVAMKAVNFASLDPQHRARSIKALGNVSRADRQLWDAFLQDPARIAQEAEEAYVSIVCAGYDEYVPELGLVSNGCSPESSSPRNRDRPTLELPNGPTEVEAVRKVRRVQGFFRASVLASYNSRCALTQLALPQLLSASHIVPWSADDKRRADPRNGICLNAFHDRAFDRGLITFSEDLRVMASPSVMESDLGSMGRDLLLGVSGQAMQPPDRFWPDPDALEYHRLHVFRALD